MPTSKRKAKMFDENCSQSCSDSNNALPEDVKNCGACGQPADSKQNVAERIVNAQWRDGSVDANLLAKVLQIVVDKKPMPYLVSFGLTLGRWINSMVYMVGGHSTWSDYRASTCNYIAALRAGFGDDGGGDGGGDVAGDVAGDVGSFEEKDGGGEKKDGGE